MHMTGQIAIPGGILSYGSLDTGMGFIGNVSGDDMACIISYEGSAKQIRLPDHIDGRIVSVIGKKAFLGNRYLQSVTLPDTIEAVGDWAFSGCHMLRKIKLPKKEISFGRHVFQKSGQLQEVLVSGEDKGLASLLALAVAVLDSQYLLAPMQAGSDAWHQNLDARILAFLEEPEEYALKDLVYCAEEDMGAKQEACLQKQAYQKAKAAFLRLLYPAMMHPDIERQLIKYLRQRTKGCQDESAWECVKLCMENKLQYCDKLYEIGGIHEENISAVLDDLGDDNIELKAFLLRKWQDEKPDNSCWPALDWG